MPEREKISFPQALRRVDAGTLEPERVERLGRAFERLERQMSELKQQFGSERVVVAGAAASGAPATK